MHLNHAYMCDELSYHTELCFQFYTCQEKHCVRIEHGSRSLDAEHAVALFFFGFPVLCRGCGRSCRKVCRSCFDSGIVQKFMMVVKHQSLPGCCTGCSVVQMR